MRNSEYLCPWCKLYGGWTVKEEQPPSEMTAVVKGIFGNSQVSGGKKVKAKPLKKRVRILWMTCYVFHGVGRMRRCIRLGKCLEPYWR